MAAADETRQDLGRTGAQEPRAASRPGSFRLAATALAGALVLGLAAVAYGFFSGGGEAGAPVVVRADGAPVKVKPELDPRVFLLRIFPGLDPRIPMAILPNVKGLVVEAYGAGNFPSDPSLHRSLTPVFDRARTLGLPVVVVSQAPRNGVDLSLYESGNQARSYGAISGGDLTVSAAVVKLMHGLGNYRGDALRKYLERSVAGERT
jgi:L-asparaginase/Glu-tRNA(Gln) amidotransferase subunit D